MFSYAAQMRRRRTLKVLVCLLKDMIRFGYIKGHMLQHVCLQHVVSRLPDHETVLQHTDELVHVIG